MKKEMQQTSLDAYKAIEEVDGKRKSVLEALNHFGEASNLDIAEHLGWQINRVTGRMNELVKLGLVEEAKKDFSKQTGRRVIFWRVKV